MSSPRLSIALIADSKIPGLLPQNIWMLIPLPSLSLTSTWGKHNKQFIHTRKMTVVALSKCQVRTRAGCPVGPDRGLGNGLWASSSLKRAGNPGGVGVKGRKLVDGVRDELAVGVDSSSLLRSFIFCRSSFKYSIASPSIDVLSICPNNNFVGNLIGCV